MINQNVAIVVVTGVGPWYASLFFENTLVAKYLQLGDEFISGSGASIGKKYKVISGTWTGSPDFANGGAFTFEWADDGAPVTPAADSGFLSVMFTPGQEDIRPELQVKGVVGNISVYSGPNYEYLFGVLPSTPGASWNDPVEAANAVVGDYIACSNGKMYEISFLGATKFSEPFRVVEVAKEGELPPTGSATLFRPTAGWERYQGDDLSDDARNRLYIADMARLDKKIPGDKQAYIHTITSGEVSAKEFILDPAPLVPSEVEASVAGGLTQKNGPDFAVAGNVFSWSGLNLDGILADGDEIILGYFS